MTADPIQSFSDRAAGRPLQPRTEEVPWHLSDQLRSWLRGFLTPQTERRVANRLRLSLGAPSGLGEAIDAAHATTSGNLISQLHNNDQLLDAIDYALRLDETLGNQLRWHRLIPDSDHPDNQWSRLEQVADLNERLEDCGSTLVVVARDDRARLAHRVDPTGQHAADLAMSSDNTTAANLLARAWSKAYDRDGDPDGAYHDAVRAVEALVCPRVLPDSTRATLSTVTRHLTSPAGPRDWELLLSKLGDGSIDPLVEMFDRLWHGNLASRHGSDETTYREVTLDEARAGVQLAVLCVQWLTDGVLRRRQTSGTP